jgi:hypothetical protein
VLACSRVTTASAVAEGSLATLLLHGVAAASAALAGMGDPDTMASTPSMIRAGSVAAAACELGISQTTVRQHLSGLYRRTGCLNAAQAAYRLGRSEASA